MHNVMLWSINVSIVDPETGKEYNEVFGRGLSNYLGGGGWLSDERPVLDGLSDEIRKRHPWLSEYLINVWAERGEYEYLEDEHGWLSLHRVG